MKKALVCSLVVGAVFAAGSVNAQIQSRITFTGTAQWQATTTTNGNNQVRVAHVKSVAFNMKTIIARLNSSPAYLNAAGAGIPSGSWFALDDNAGHIVVTNKNGYSRDLTALVDANGTSFATAHIANSVSVGREQVSTLHGNHTDTGVGTFTFQDGSNNAGDPTTNSVSSTGLIMMANSYNAVSGLTQVFSRTFHTTGVGNGLVGSKPAVVQGRASGQGRGTEFANLNPPTPGELPQVVVP